MKVKLKLDTAAIKGFFAEHVEKFVLGFAVIVLLWFTVSIFQRESLPANLKPDAISAKSDKAIADVNSMPHPPDSEGVTQKPFQKIVGDFVNGHTMMDDRPWETPPILDPLKRTDPVLFAVEGLQATSGRGALVKNASAGAGMPPGMAPSMAPSALGVDRGGVPVAPPGPPPSAPPGRAVRRPGAPGGPAAQPPLPVVGGPPPAQGPQPIPPGFFLPGPQAQGGAESRSFVVVTGAIPEGKQLDEFKKRFDLAMKGVAAGADAVGPRGAADGDVPRYIWWRLERTDTTDPTAPVTKVIDCGDVQKFLADFQNDGKVAQQALKPDAQFKDLFADLKTWGVQVPDVVDRAFLEDPWLSWPLPPILLRDWGLEAAHPLIVQLMNGGGAEQPGALPGAQPAPGGDNPFGDAGAAAPAPRSAQPPGGAAGFPLGPRAAVQGPPPVAGPGIDPRMMGMPGMQGGQATTVPYKLYRFVDFNVEPGHTYAYRVQLVMVNPNYGLPPEVVAKPEANLMPYRDTPFSNWTGPATIPVDKQILAVGGERSRRGEVKGKAAVLLWDKDDSLELVKDFDIELGAVANFTKETVKQIVDPANRQVRDVTADFITDAVLIDVRGGDDKSLPADKQQGEPAELLFFGPGGKLIEVSAARDKPTIDGWERTHKVPADLLNPAPGASGGGIFGQPNGGQPMPLGPHPAGPPGLFPGMSVPAKQGPNAKTPIK